MTKKYTLWYKIISLKQLKGLLKKYKGAEIARYFGCSRSVIYALIKKHNLKRPKQKCPKCDKSFVPSSAHRVYCSELCGRLMRSRIDQLKHKDKRYKAKREWYQKNKENQCKKARIYYQKHKKKLNLQSKKWKKKNKGSIRLYKKQYRSFPHNKITHALRSRLNAAIKKEYKMHSIVKLIGCTNRQLQKYLEKQFKYGMTWSNYGIKGWHIDHIRPCASFDLTKKSEQCKCFHYTNLQPLWAEDNYKKHDKIINKRSTK